MINAVDCVIAWSPRDCDGDPHKGEILVVGIHETHRIRHLQCNVGAVNSEWKDFSDEVRTILVFAEFAGIVVEGEIEVDKVHAEFCKIKEYTQRIAPDIKGAIR